MIYLFQRIIQNHFQWTRPSPGRLGPSGEGKYVQDNGFGHEDWNFNQSLLVDSHVQGYCYYRPRESKRDERFGIAFATYTNKQWYLIGFYLNSEFVENPPTCPEVLARKMQDLRHLGNSLGSTWRKLSDKQFLDHLAEDAMSLTWRVSPNNVIRLPEPVPIPRRLFDTKNYRIVKPTEINKAVFDSMFALAGEYVPNDDHAADEEFPEGREFERQHKMRERNQAAIAAAKKSFREKHGRLYCQVCGFDFLEHYGEVGRDFIEAHHTVPLSSMKGETKTRLSDLALVCANCHRMLHRQRPWLDMKNLERLITKPQCA